jgi:hypothetical protein
MTAGPIDVEIRGPEKPRVSFKETQRLSILAKCGKEPRVLSSGKLDHAQFRDHDRPTENRPDRKQQENNFSRNGRVIEGEQQTIRG